MEDKLAEMNDYEFYIEKLKEEGRFSGESYQRNTEATVVLMELMAAACGLLEEIRDELKIRKDDGK